MAVSANAPGTGVGIDDAWNQLIGPFYLLDEVAALIRLDAAAVRAALQRGKLLAATTGDGVLVFPVFQFDPAGHALPGVEHVVQLLRGRMDDWGILLWLGRPSRALGATPVEALRGARLNEVVALAAASTP